MRGKRSMLGHEGNRALRIQRDRIGRTQFIGDHDRSRRHVPDRGRLFRQQPA